jgi:hypothetical protein
VSLRLYTPDGDCHADTPLPDGRGDDRLEHYLATVLPFGGRHETRLGINELIRAREQLERVS